MTDFPASHRYSFAPTHRGMVAVDDGDGSTLFYRVSRPLDIGSYSPNLTREGFLYLRSVFWESIEEATKGETT